MDWNSLAGEYLAVADLVFGPLRDPVDQAADRVVECLRAGNKVLICGNGGSAADAQHMAAELVNRFMKERRPYAAVALTTDTSILTAVGNDYSYDEVFEKQVQALGKAGDVLVAISTSGKASNVGRAVEAAKSLGVTTIGLTGGQGGALIDLVDHPISISCSTNTARIQEGHGLIIHALCERIEEILG